MKEGLYKPFRRNGDADQMSISIASVFISSVIGQFNGTIVRYPFKEVLYSLVEVENTWYDWRGGIY